MELSIPIPLDEDGFVRRECPSCSREFKWLYAESEEDATPHEPGGFYCPYCGVQSNPGSWFTRAQVDFIQQVGLGAAADHADKVFAGLDRPGGPMTYTPGDRPVPPSSLPPEPNDMERIEFRCHPDDPLKVKTGWESAVRCLICGTPVDLDEGQD